MLQNHHTKNVKLVSASFQFYLVTNTWEHPDQRTLVEVWYNVAIY